MFALVHQVQKYQLLRSIEEYVPSATPIVGYRVWQSEAKAYPKLTSPAEADSILPRTGPSAKAGLTWVLPAILAFFAACIAFIPYASDAENLLLRDPDNYLRLAEIRDWLVGQSWWDVTQYRMAPPEGVRMHWSRLADLPVAAFISIFAQFVGFERAEIWAVVAVPLLLLFALLMVLARGAKSLGGNVAATAAPVLALTVPMILAQFVPGRIDHHGLQLLCLTGGIAAALGTECRRTGAILAFLMAFSLVVGLETLPMFALIVTWLVVRWIVEGETAFPKLLGFVAGIAVSLPLLHFISTDPSLWFQATSDQIGRGHLTLTLAPSAILLVGFRKWQGTRFERALTAIAASLGAFAVLIYFPEILQAPYADVDDLANRIWISNIAETSSVLDYVERNPLTIVTWFTFPILAFATALWLLSRVDGTQRNTLLALLVLGGIVLSAWQVRMNAMASIPAIFVAACLIERGWRYWKREKHLLPLVLVVVLMHGALGPVIAFVANRDPATRATLTESPSTSCAKQIAEADLDRFLPGLVLTATSFGGLTLVHSHHSILTSSSHRNHRANSEGFRMLMAPPDQALEMLRKRGVDYILYCRNLEFSLEAELAENGLINMLMADESVDGISELDRAEGVDYRLYEVAGPGNSYAEVQ